MSLLDYQAQFGRPSEEQQNALAHQVKRISEELRRVRPLRGRKICRFDGSALDDPRIQLLGGSFGPFESVEDFQDALLGYSVLEIPEDEKEPVMDRITRAFSSPRAVVLTHGDLTPANILVDKDLKITGVIDWATASWMPDYWELIKSIFLLQYRRGYWRKVMEQVYPGYGDVVEADQLIQKYRRVYT
ncbi:hypothetical protein GLOTRDRAFT_132852 [Gloeophyllum trabeum ATCC 11539]|uniref:Aminoglycoside phosphotransferase domain-containing protein n=1 Tax=Gloeophyllum trabeum (strain ATCC 11539 / FP-39264 / Madison 617) TaxID=670483 RepID=S7PW03_GLOTA|nr:uncharacterized protein GLOTRDRAFT_132852 [Gloeophyllum trabeum ATCC 11539]EPQ51487.1 hypothetical protein GLOTRDRAFT_132852 [Gloeophyllum trabeum ATCC 11539]